MAECQALKTEKRPCLCPRVKLLQGCAAEVRHFLAVKKHFSKCFVNVTCKGFTLISKDPRIHRLKVRLGSFFVLNSGTVAFTNGLQMRHAHQPAVKDYFTEFF